MNSGYRQTAFNALLVLTISSLLIACSDNQGARALENAQTLQSATIITTTKVKRQEVIVTRHSVGKLESRNVPTIAAEIEARVLAVEADVGDPIKVGDLLLELDTTTLKLERRAAAAVINSINAKIDNEIRRVKRYTNLQKNKLLAREQLEDAQAQLAVLRASMDAATAQLYIAEDRLSKARVVAPANGIVQKRYVSVGDFVKIGAPLLMLSDNQALRAVLPFPETLSPLLEIGQQVRLTSPTAPEIIYNGLITDLKPMIAQASRAIIVIVDIDNPGGWRPEATVEGTVIVTRHRNATVIPSQAVVRRPVGEVVYVIEGNNARQQLVILGEYLDGRVEIQKGLDGHETIALDGAHYLTDGTPVLLSKSGT